MKNPTLSQCALCLVLVLAPAALSASGIRSVIPGKSATLALHGLREPITLTVENTDGWVHIEEGGEEGSITATVDQVRSTPQEMPVGFSLENLGPAHPGGPDRVIASVRPPTRQKQIAIQVLSLDPQKPGVQVSTEYQMYRETLTAGSKKPIGEMQPAGAARIVLRLPPSLLGHVQVRTWRAWVGFQGFATPPVEGFERIIRLETRRRPLARAGLNTIHHTHLIESDSRGCDESLCQAGIDISALFDFYPSSPYWRPGH